MSATVTAGRRTVEISRPDKLLIPPGITKLALAEYHARIAETMLVHAGGRPLNYERYPDGIDGHKIFQQHAGGHFPDWIRRVEVPKHGGTVEHVVATEPATLVYLANQACITLHSWLSRADRIDRPDRMIFDLDPTVERPAEMRDAARTIVALLGELGLTPWAMTSGSRGYHLVVALQRRAGYDTVRQFSRDVAELAVRRAPRVFTIEQRKAKRDGRILIDYMRNGYGHTSVAPYSVRARPDGPVATPLHLDELSERETTPQRWTVATVPERIERDGDPWVQSPPRRRASAPPAAASTRPGRRWPAAILDR
jgi:bifunctional non-homologous end joining protein LigD